MVSTGMSHNLDRGTGLKEHISGEEACVKWEILVKLRVQHEVKVNDWRAGDGSSSRDYLCEVGFQSLEVRAPSEAAHRAWRHREVVRAGGGRRDERRGQAAHELVVQCGRW